MKLAIVGAGIALATWAFTLFATSFECSFDTSECASSRALTEYRGRLFDYEGRPAGGFVLTFQSDLYGRRFQAPVPTDDQGRFCVRAVAGTTIPSIGVVDQKNDSQLVVRSNAPVDPRFRDPRLRESLRRRGSAYRGLDRAGFMTAKPASSVVKTPSFYPQAVHWVPDRWTPSTDSSPSCHGVGASPPWYKFEDVHRTWQFGVLSLAPLATLSLLAFGVVVRESSRRRQSISQAGVAERIFKATLAAGLLTLLLAFVLWSIP